MAFANEEVDNCTTTIPEFLPYPDLFNYHSSDSDSNRSSYSSIDNEIKDDLLSTEIRVKGDYALVSPVAGVIEDSLSPVISVDGDLYSSEVAGDSVTLVDGVIEDSVSSSALSVIEETLYVALSADIEEGVPILLWVMQNFVGYKICIVHIHVHVPKPAAQYAQSVDFVGGRFPANSRKEQEHRWKHRQLEKRKMQNLLNEYLLICEQVGVQAEKLYIETSCIEKGIVQVISQYGIQRLVMGAAAKTRYSRTMTDPMSEKAKYVNTEAPVTCHIWFVCKGHLIYTREGRLGVVNEDAMPKVEQTSPNPETEESEAVTACSVTFRPSTQQNDMPSVKPYVNLNYNEHERAVEENYHGGVGGVSISKSALDLVATSDEWEGISSIHLSQGSPSRPSASSDVFGSLDLTHFVSAEGTQESSFRPSASTDVLGSLERIFLWDLSQGSPSRPSASSDVPGSLTLTHFVSAEGTQGSSFCPSASTDVLSSLEGIFLKDLSQGSPSCPSASSDVLSSLDLTHFVSPEGTQGSSFRPSASTDVLSSLDLIHFVSAEGTQGSQDEDKPQLLALPAPKDDVNQASPSSDEKVDPTLNSLLEEAMAEARNSSFEASKERVRRGIAEKKAAEATLRARASESVYADELKQRKEAEAALLRERVELRKIQNQRDEIRHELQYARDQQSQLESRIAESDNKVRELEERIISAVGLLKSYKKQKDDLQRERDNALKLVEDLRRKQAKLSSRNLSKLVSEFSFFEIEEATQSFDPSLKIGEGGYGSIYKGLLRHTEVAIKMLHSHSMQGPSEYQQEVDILSKLRHPNLVTLIGACPDAWTLIYEYLPNGSLEDRLNCKDNSPPLSWQTRIRIAAELCSALVFLHSSKPHSIVHGDLKPSNILLDANLITKLSDFGICRVVLPDENASIEATACYRADPQGTYAYMDPELFSSGELTTKSDVYSFGIVLLRLLTGKAAVGITKEVQNALDNGNLKSLLDCSAGDWPYVQAHQLTHLALRCVEMNRRKRPDLGSEVWRVLQAMHASCGGSSSSLRIGTEDPCQAPHYFICPIFQEVMQDPHVAADGFTYEAESLRGWLDSGHDTSPMTNLKLEHTNLVPNLALRSAIQEWLQRQQQ